MALPASRSTALSHLRICDLTGQLAGAGATKFLAAFGAQVIRVEDPVRQGTWDILRGVPPYVDERRGINLGGAFNNHNVEKLGITIDLRQARGKELLRKLVAVSDAVTENFAAGVFARMGFPYDELQRLKPDIVYVSNSGFGASGPYSSFRTWGPIVQAISGLTFSSGLPDLPPAGWGFSYMDHMGANYMAVAILAGLIHRNRTGEGQWIDMGCTEAGLSLCGPDLLDYTVNDRPLRRTGQPNSNRSHAPAMAPHNIYAARGTDEWIAIACRDDDDWARLAAMIDEPWAVDPKYATLDGRLDDQDALDAHMGAWTRTRDRHATAEQIRAAGVPASVVASPEDRIDHDPGHERVRAVAGRAPHRDRRRSGGRHSGAHVGDRLVDRARRPVSRRAHRRCPARRARPRRRRDRVAPRGRRWYDRDAPTAGPLDGCAWSSSRASTPPGQESSLPSSAPTWSSSNRRAATRAARTDHSSMTSPDPNAACSGGTTTRRSAASCSTSTMPTMPTRFRDLAADADIVLEGEPTGRLAELGLDHEQLRADHPELIWVAVTPFGRTTSRAHDPATDLTLLAGGGPAWNCGYDDHTIPPVRGGGNQAFHIASVFAAMSALTAILQRDVSGRGQFIDVSMHAAANVTTESGSFDWLVAKSTVIRQTGRHALATVTQETQVECVDGRYVNTGFPPRHAKDFESLRDWVDELGWRDEFDEIVLLDLAVERGGISLAELREDPLTAEIYGAGRSTLVFLAERLTPEEFFVGAQQRGIAVGAVWSPEEAFTNEHFVARGFPVEVEHEDIGRTITYPGAPFIAPKSPWRISRRPPHVGEHQGEVFGEG